MIRIEGVSKTFQVPIKSPGLKGTMRSLFKKEMRQVQALRPIDLEIHPGEILGLIGQNGAGKTTLVKILSGIINRSSGKVSVVGFDPWKRENALRRQLSLIMGQKAQLWWDLPAMDCFFLLKEIYQLEDTSFKRSIGELAERLKVTKLLDTQIRRLSLGERMKVELMACLLHQPKVIFLDEPTIGLDITAQKSIRQFLKEYREDHEPIMILTSHYMEDIESLCKRIVILSEGQQVYEGQLDRVQEIRGQSKNIVMDLSFCSSEQRQALEQKFPQGQLLEERFIITAKEEDVSPLFVRITQTFPEIPLTVEKLPLADLIEKIMNREEVNL